jgi:hypothetical protein
MTQSRGKMRNSSFSSLCESAWKSKLLGLTSIYDRGPMPQQKAGRQAGAHPSSKDAIRSVQYYGVTSNSIKSRRYDSHRGAFSFFSQCLDRTHITAVGEVAARPGAGVKLGLNGTWLFCTRIMLTKVKVLILALKLLQREQYSHNARSVPWMTLSWLFLLIIPNPG